MFNEASSLFSFFFLLTLFLNFTLEFFSNNFHFKLLVQKQNCATQCVLIKNIHTHSYIQTYTSTQMHNHAYLHIHTDTAIHKNTRVGNTKVSFNFLLNNVILWPHEPFILIASLIFRLKIFIFCLTCCWCFYCCCGCSFVVAVFFYLVKVHDVVFVVLNKIWTIYKKKFDPGIIKSVFKNTPEHQWAVKYIF